MITNCVHCLGISKSQTMMSQISNLKIETVKSKIALTINTPRSYWSPKILSMFKLILLVFFSLQTIFLRRTPGDVYGFGIMGGNKVGIYIKDIERRILSEIHNIKNGWKIISVIFYTQVLFFIYILWIYFLSWHFALRFS